MKNRFTAKKGKRLGFNQAIVLSISTLLVSNVFASDDDLWYAGNAVDNLFLSASEACQNFNMSSIGYPSCTYERAEITYPDEPYRGAKCFHKCGTNSINLVNAGVKKDYVVLLPNKKPEPKCKAGNPINIENGEKLQIETDIAKMQAGGVSFSRYYSSQASGTETWRQNYSKKLEAITTENSPKYRFKSSSSSSKAGECYVGWSELKNEIAEPWIAGSSASYLNNECRIVNNGVVVQRLPIIRNFIVTPTSDFIPDLVELTREDGANYHYRKIGFNQFVELSGRKGTLEYIDSDEYKWRYTDSSRNVELYSKAGHLLKLVSSSGVEQTLTYDDTTGVLTSVLDSLGRKIDFSYVDNKLSSIKLNDLDVTSYQYNSVGAINKVIFPDNSNKVYHYENSSFPLALTGITDELGVRYASWSYDAEGRAISSEHAIGIEKVSLAFNPEGTTTVTNSLGKKTTYHFSNISGSRVATKIEGVATPSCEGANKDYTYTNEGWLESKTDWSGVKTKFFYDSLGRETQRIEGFGTAQQRTLSTEWHPTLFLKTKISDSLVEQVFNYDDNGKLLSQTTRSVPVL